MVAHWCFSNILIKPFEQDKKGPTTQQQQDVDNGPKEKLFWLALECYRCNY